MKWLFNIFKSIFGFFGKTGSRTAQETVSFAFGQASAEALEPFFREVMYWSNLRTTNNKASIDDYIYAYFKGKVSDGELRENLKQLGYDDRQINIMIESRKALLDVGAIQELYRRGEISEAEAKNCLSLLGYSSDEQEKILKIAKSLLSIYDIQELYRRGEISEAEAKNRLSKLGYSSEEQEKILNISKSLLDVRNIQELYNRGEITVTEAKKRFAELGYGPKEQEELIKLAGYIPSVSDFIRFGIREVFTPEIAQKYGLFEDYPEELTKYAKMSGLDPKFAKMYWAAHWELPSYTQGVEMYHRGIISYDELKTLLRSLDVMPYWRDKLIKLAETPYTRVDVRRMYQLGVLSFDEMIKAYMDLGYTREKAEKLAEFTSKDATEEERNLTKTEVTSLYHYGTITRDEAKNFLKEIGYPSEQIELILSLEDYKIGKERLDKIKSTVKKRYIRGFIDRNDVMVLLSKQGIPSREVENLILEWDIEKEEKAGLPTKTELGRFLKKNIINEEQYKEYMRRIGYDDEVIEMYLKDLKEE